MSPPKIVSPPQKIVTSSHKNFFPTPPPNCFATQLPKYLLPHRPLPPSTTTVCPFSVSTFMCDLSTFENLCVPNQSPVCSFTLSDIYCPATKLWEGNVFTGICSSTGEGISGPMSFRGGVRVGTQGVSTRPQTWSLLGDGYSPLLLTPNGCLENMYWNAFLLHWH